MVVNTMIFYTVRRTTHVGKDMYVGAYDMDTCTHRTFKTCKAMRGELAQELQDRPNVNILSKKCCAPTRLAAINVIAQPENYHLSCKFQYDIESAVASPLYDCKELPTFN